MRLGTQHWRGGLGLSQCPLPHSLARSLTLGGCSNEVSTHTAMHSLRHVSTTPLPTAAGNGACEASPPRRTKRPPLTSLDLSACLLDTLPKAVFAGCDDVDELILPHTITRIQAGALEGCKSLRRLDMGLLTGLTTLPNNFLSHCMRLEEVILPPSITHLGSNFLRGGKLSDGTRYPPLKRLDISSLAGLRNVSRCFMAGCAHLEEVLLPPSVAAIGKGFLEGCCSIKRLDLGGLSRLHSLPTRFVVGCVRLEEVLLPPSIQHVPTEFLHSMSVKRLDLRACNNLTSLPLMFMSDCSKLEELILPPSVSAIDWRCLMSCTSLKRLDLSANINLQTLGTSFLSECSKLEELILPPSVSAIDWGFLMSCTSLKRLDLSALTNLQTLGTSFFV